jgi:uncharacterized membrane protein
MRGLLAVGALLLLQIAGCCSLGTLEPVSLTLVLTALALALAASVLRWPPRWEALGRRWLPHALLALAGADVALLLTTPAALQASASVSLLPFHLAVAGLGLVVLSYAFRSWKNLRWRFLLVVVLYSVLGAWILVAVPAPVIDVLVFQERASDLLLHGRDPYDAAYPNVYAGNPEFYGPGVLRNGQVWSCPYPPLSLLLALPGHLVGDVRWGLLAAMLVSAILLIAAGRSLAGAAAPQVELAAIAFLCHPRGLVVLHFGWTEPLLMGAVCFFAWAAARRRTALAGVSAGLVIAMKQYAVLLVPPLWACRCLGGRQLLVAGATAALITLPFVLWDPLSFWQGVVMFQVEQPFRDDALSVLAAVKAATGVELSAAIGFVVAAGATGLVVWRAPLGLAAAALGGAAIFISFFAFNKQAFLNYYWFCASLLALALAQSRTRSPSRPSRPAARQTPAAIASEPPTTTSGSAERL